MSRDVEKNRVSSRLRHRRKAGLVIEPTADEAAVLDGEAVRARKRADEELARARESAPLPHINPNELPDLNDPAVIQALLAEAVALIRKGREFTGKALLSAVNVSINARESLSLQAEIDELRRRQDEANKLFNAHAKDMR